MKLVIFSSDDLKQETTRVKMNIEDMDIKILNEEDITKEKEDTSVLSESDKIKKEKEDLDRLFKKIKQSDGIIITNFKKDNIDNYIDPKHIFYIVYTYTQGKKIFILNGITKQSFSYILRSLQPIILNGDIDVLNNYK